jgi:hypothetical protein
MAMQRLVVTSSGESPVDHDLRDFAKPLIIKSCQRARALKLEMVLGSRGLQSVISSPTSNAQTAGLA